jgi:hypothetical protein
MGFYKITGFSMKQKFILKILLWSILLNAWIFRSVAYGATFENPITSTTVPLLIADLVRAILGFLGALCAVLIAYCGFRYMTAGGDSSKSKGAVECIINAVLGLIIAMAAYLVADYIIGAVSELA